MDTYTIIVLALLGIMLIKQLVPSIGRSLTTRKKEGDIDWVDVLIIIIIIIIIIILSTKPAY